MALEDYIAPMTSKGPHLCGVCQWKPSRTPGHVGLGMGRVLDFIGVPYE